MKYLALGDSYTKGEGIVKELSFPYQITERLNCKDVQVIAETGWTTRDLINGISNTNLSKQYDLISLCIGVNNQYQGKGRKQYAEELQQIFEVILSLQPDCIVCFSIPNYGYTSFGRNWQSYISSDLLWYNNFFKEICELNNGTWIDIESISKQGLETKDMLAQDNLHPSGKMYTLFTDELMKKLN